MRRLLHISIVALTLLFHSTFSIAAPVNSAETIVQTVYGEVEGSVIEEFDVVSWKGIPYAKPPTDNLRWKAPQDAEAWQSVRDATDYESRCGRAEEDCLYLNVWSPVSSHPGQSDTNRGKGGLLPVFFYIHGGSNVGGSGQGSWYTVAHHYNVVVVAINYRLGAMGWFSHPALQTGDPMDDSGNFGLLDQVKALQWVRDNIAAFGGDPDNVTIAGASAGAQNVSYLMHTHLAKDLFHKAIMESNFPGIRPVSAAFKSSKQVLYNLLVADGTAVDPAAARDHVATLTDAEISDYFYSQGALDIRNSYSNAYWGGINWGDFYRDDIVAGNSFIPPPVVQASEFRPEFVYTIGDGYVLPDDIDFADFSPGHVFPKPIVVGTTKNENNFWNAFWPFNFRTGVPLEELVAEVVDGTAAWWLLPFLQGIGTTAEEFMENYKFSTELIDEVDIYLGAHLSARNLAKAKPSVPIYVYRFDWGSDPDKDYRIPFQDAWTFYVGAPHVAEGNFFWQRFFGLADGGSVGGYQYTDDNLHGRLELSLATKSYLAEFMHKKTGHIPQKQDQPVKWEPWTKNNERLIVFDADHDSLDVFMNSTDIARTPQELFDAHLAHPNDVVRDFIEYYIMWSWHWNWYPNASVGPFDTAPGPNPLFDPLQP